jgi:Leucine-rich repeat (LRR) protein
MRWSPFCYRRGFAWRLMVFDLDGFLSEAPRLFALAPIGALDVDARSVADLSGLAKSPWLARIERLEFSLGELSPVTIRQLLDSPHLGRLRELAFEFAGITGPGLRLLLSSPLAGRMRGLGLGNNFFADHGRQLGEAFAASAPLPALEALDLSGNRITYEAFMPLVARGLAPALRELDVGGNELSEGVFEAVASAWPRLETLKLEKTKPGTGGTVQIAKLGGLRALHLGGCGLGPVAAGALAGSERLAGLRVLDLGDNRIGDTGAAALARSPHLTQLASLDLRRAKLTDAGAKALLDSPTLSGLIHLDLHDNALSQAVVERVRDRFGRFSASDPEHARPRRRSSK